MSLNLVALLRATIVVALVATLSFVEAPRAVAVTTHKPLNDTRAVGSAPVEVEFPIEYFGLVADLPRRSGRLPEPGRAPYGEARFRVDGRWTPWQALGEDGAQAAGQFTGALVSVDGADAYQVRGLPAGADNWRAAAINTTDGPTVVVGHRRADSAAAAPACMSRADWGADESISGWTRNGDNQVHSPAQVMTAHHTAGSNNPDQDYAATVRAIYSYHVKSNGWSDIGYLYLVDGQGTVYEGRSSGHTSRSCLYDGGDGSDFAHDPVTDEVVTGAHVSRYNTGNIGIALLGCYEPASTTCTGDTQPPAAQVEGLAAELALLSERHAIDPEGTVRYVNPVNGATKDVATISGHRDYGSTQCPGGTLYSQLPAIRSDVASRTGGSPPADSAVVAFASRRSVVQEDAGAVELVLTRSGNTDVPASVEYARTTGSATPGGDFTLTSGTVSFGAGETTKTIPLGIEDDSTPEGRETVVVSLTDPGTATVLGTPASTKVVIAPSDQQPDGWISTAAGSGYTGNGIYNASGYRQTKRLNADRTRTRSFYVRVYNDGNVKGPVVLTGSAPRAGSSVRYYSGATDVTGAMRSAAGWKVRVGPGRFRLVKVEIKVLRTAAYGTRKVATVTGTWTGDGTRRDRVKAVVKVVR
ncbi:MAG TPA: N-acetylmuramoyl-L-alanine amidase [Nocardioidaceae bacterium]|nr:N-acetylmuramoyl-L-alanine amidase [Nocardioidaceae bacterium]